MAETGNTGTVGLERVPAAAGQGKTAADQAVQMWSVLQQRIAGMAPGRRNWLIGSVTLLAAMCAGLLWYAQRPDWRVLFSGLDGKDVQQVAQELAAAGIPYEMSADGAGVEVPAEMLDKARMEVAAKGMPQTGRLGFELFDKPNWVGSEFDERVNYQRALEGELEHTIGTLSAVRSARVHLALPQQSLFASEDKVAKASVVLKLKRPAMDEEQADAIRSLVAGSVDNLSPEQVTLVDADGRVNLKPRSKDTAASDVEQAMEAKLVEMLEPLAGRDNVRATVNVSYDEAAEERMDEVYDPAQVAAVTMQKSEQTSAGQSRPSGVPGTASNSPAAAPTGAVAGSQAAAAPGTPPLLQKEALPVYPQNGVAGQSLRQENGTYAVSKHVMHSELGPGRVRRVTAAVLVNDRAVMEGTGKSQQTVWRARSPEEMRRLEQLAQAAVGFDEKRGDQVVIENVGFTSNAPEPVLPPAERALNAFRNLLHAEPGLARTMMIGLCGVVLVVFVLRPMAKQVTSTLKEPMLLAASTTSTEALNFSVPESISTQAQPELAPVLKPALKRHDDTVAEIRKMASEQRGVLEQVSEHIRREPAQSARLLETWIGVTEGAE
jgi:flagellar M-ring protein FliF